MTSRNEVLEVQQKATATPAALGGDKVSEGSYKDGKRVGLWITYNNNKVSSKGTFKDNIRDGPWEDYDVLGKLVSKGTFKDGKEDGPWVYYTIVGRVDEKLTGTYIDGKKVY